MKTVETGRDFKASNADNENRVYDITADVHVEKGKVTRIQNGSVTSKDGGLIFGSFSQTETHPGHMQDSSFTLTCNDPEIAAEVSTEIFAFVKELREDVASDYQQKEEN